MVKIERRDVSASEAANFQAHPNTESDGGNCPALLSSAGREPTAEQLRFYRDMTQEEWHARVAEGKRQSAEIVAQGRENRGQWEERSRERWKRRIRALESIEPSGNAALDAQQFFEAINLDPNTLGSPYAQAYKNGDSNMLLRYFREVERNTRELPPSLSEAALQYFEVFDEVVRKIITAAEIGPG